MTDAVRWAPELRDAVGTRLGPLPPSQRLRESRRVPQLLLAEIRALGAERDAKPPCQRDVLGSASDLRSTEPPRGLLTGRADGARPGVWCVSPSPHASASSRTSTGTNSPRPSNLETVTSHAQSSLNPPVQLGTQPCACTRVRVGPGHTCPGGAWVGTAGPRGPAGSLVAGYMRRPANFGASPSLSPGARRAVGSWGGHRADGQDTREEARLVHVVAHLGTGPSVIGFPSVGAGCPRSARPGVSSQPRSREGKWGTPFLSPLRPGDSHWLSPIQLFTLLGDISFEGKEV